MGSKLVAALAAVTLVTGLSAQQRVFFNGTPSNMFADWGQIAALPDATGVNSFVAIMPLAAVPTWASWEPDESMNNNFGPGNWIRVRMDAPEWAYLSPDACAHQPAAGASAPESLLTSSYDFGVYNGMVGSPLFPGASWFPGSGASYVEGLPGWTFERWQLRTRGFWTNELWNACPGSSTVTPNFTGYLGVRFTFTLQ